MKKVLIATNLLLLVAGIYCWTRLSTARTELSAANAKLADCRKQVHDGQQPPSDNAQVCMECAEKTQGEEVQHFIEVIQNYRTKVWDVVNESRMDASNTSLFFTPTKNVQAANINYSNTDSRSIWWSLETIKQFICSIESYNAQLDNPATELGLRFYFGAYPRGYDPEHGRGDRHTLFIMPTRGNGTGDPEEDFDPRETLHMQTDAALAQQYQLLYTRSHNGEKMTEKKISVSPSLMIQKWTADGTASTIAKMMVLGEHSAATHKASTNLKFNDHATAAGIQPNVVPAYTKNNGSLCPLQCPSNNTISIIDQYQ